MKTAAIYLHGLPGIDKPEAIKNFDYENEKDLIAELKNLQKGYTQKGDKIEISRLEQEVLGKKRTIIMALTNEGGTGQYTDWSYRALIGIRIKVKSEKVPLMERTDVKENTEEYGWLKAIKSHIEWIRIYIEQGDTQEASIQKMKERSAFTKEFWDAEIIPFISYTAIHDKH